MLLFLLVLSVLAMCVGMVMLAKTSLLGFLCVALLASGFMASKAYGVQKGQPLVFLPKAKRMGYIIFGLIAMPFAAWALFWFRPAVRALPEASEEAVQIVETLRFALLWGGAIIGTGGVLASLMAAFPKAFGFTLHPVEGSTSAPRNGAVDHLS